MVKRTKITITLGQPIVDWLKSKVDEGEYPSMGWAVEMLVREKIASERAKKSTKVE